MKRITAISLSALVIGILACGGSGDNASSDDADEGGDDAVTVDLPTVPITEPWKSMGLPTNSGQVVASDASVLLVAHGDASVSGITADYTSAIASDGWSKGDDYSTPDFTAIVYTKGAQSVGFACGIEQEITFAYMEDLGKVGGDSTVRAAKTGRHTIKGTAKYRANRRNAKRVGTKGSGSTDKGGSNKKGGANKKGGGRAGH